MKKDNAELSFLLLGILFAILWSSASVAAKIGVQVMEPLVLFEFRFIVAGLILLIFSFFSKDWCWPTSKELIQLAVFGFLNVTVYLTLFVLAIKEVAAGIGSLATSLGPLFMTVIGGMFLGKKLKFIHFVALVLGLIGVFLAVFPLFEKSFATTKGIIMLLVSMLSYSVASLYFSEKIWTLPKLAINGWQVLLGGIFMFPLTLYLNKSPIEFSYKALFSITWLIIPVSIVAVNIWLRLLKINAIKASFFLLLCPIFGFIFSSFILQEPFTWHTFVGLCLALAGMYLGQK